MWVEVYKLHSFKFNQKDVESSRIRNYFYLCIDKKLPPLTRLISLYADINNIDEFKLTDYILPEHYIVCNEILTEIFGMSRPIH